MVRYQARQIISSTCELYDVSVTVEMQPLSSHISVL